MKQRGFTGTTDSKVQEYEIRHRAVARKAAAEGIVLLKNEEQVLPVSKDMPIALYGAGAGKTIKGGTGSGDVNERYSVSIYDGLINAGYRITTEDWLKKFEETYQKARVVWRDKIWGSIDEKKGTVALFDAYAKEQFLIPAGSLPEKQEAETTDTAVYVLSRVAGEGKDREEAKGDYYLADEEETILKKICEYYKKVILIINTGGPVDLSFADGLPQIKGILQISQPGCEGGNALADVFSGQVTPSGKLTDTWTLSYGDYPNAATFSHNNGNVEQERYEEGIFTGYRYFDSFGIPVRYCFGHGLSYTDFEIETVGLKAYELGGEAPELGVEVRVTNTGKQYAGREVVQVYASCPQGSLGKEYRRLTGFKKTKSLAPGESENLEIRFPFYGLASYSEAEHGWILEKGIYGFFVGNSIGNSEYKLSMELKQDVTLIATEQICPLKEELQELEAPVKQMEKRRKAWLPGEEKKPDLIVSDFDFKKTVISYGTEYDRLPGKAKEFVESLSEEQLVLLATGDPGQGQGSNLGSSGISVPGSAAQTSRCAVEQGVSDIVLADGPAGLRLAQTYIVKDGEIVREPFEKSMEGGFLCRNKNEPEGEKYYQFCTAFPVGTALAQSFDPELLQEVGKAVAEEMQRYLVTLWLAPGMNIHRNPLCGRNFEYYSEDPLVAGKMAAAMTKGVQSEHGCGTTIKHFACNNQEDNRMGSDSIISERALREIYLKGFEIAVKEAGPMSIMTSYNLVNGVHAANNFDLCTRVCRNEWDFKGLIMTDWTTTENGPDCTAAGCMRAGNDIVMPGVPADHENIKKEIKDGTLKLKDLKKSVTRIVDTVWKSNMYEE